MTAPNPSTLWGRVLTDELARAGVDHVTLAPGSRSTPLVLGFARQEDLDLHVHVDERSAAFHALGIGKATGRPAAVVTTSGTAAANLHPAVVEACYSEAPLVLLTADRPPERHGADANQTIDQTKLYGDHVVAFHDLGRPAPEADALAHLRARADRIVAEATGPPAGPVHANVPFAKPLEPTPTDAVPAALADEAPQAVHGRPERTPWTTITPSRSTLEAPALEALRARLEAADRPLVVAGPSPEPARLGPGAIALARALEAPLLADPLSGARFTPHAPSTSVPGYDLFLRSTPLAETLAPDLILRVGATPTSKRLQRWARDQDADTIVVDAGARWKDARDAAEMYLRADPADAATRLAALAPSGASKAWTSAWHEVGARTREVVDRELDEAPFEPAVARASAGALPEDGQLVVGNSNPVRDLDAYAPPRDDTLHVIGNRGASGIDGVASTAIGAASATGRPTACVLGDLSLLHDNNALHALDPDVPLTLVVVNNDGGGIFHRLPIREHEAFTEYFATPHGRDLTHLSQLHALDHERLTDPARLEDVLEKRLEDPAGGIVELTTDRERTQARHEAVIERVQETVRDVELPR